MSTRAVGVAALALLAWALTAAGIAQRRGTWATSAIVLVTLGWLALWAVVALGGLRPVSLSGRGHWLLAAPVVLLATESAWLFGGAHSFGGWKTVSDTLFRVAVAAALLTLLPAVRRWRLAWLGPALLAVAAGVAGVLASPVPHIDVWYLLQQSSTGLLHGDDMYRQHWVGSTGLQDVYPYLPVTTIALLPFRLVLGDVRYGVIAASFLASWLLRRRLPPGVTPLLSLLLLTYPRWVLGVQNAWTEPLLILALTGFVLAVESGRLRLAVVALALALACKQHIVLLLPLAALWPAFGWRRTLASVGFAVVLVLPWLVAGPADFVHDAVHANLALPVELRGLCLPSLLLHHGIHTGFGLTLVGLALGYVTAIVRLPRTASGFCLGGALVMLSLDLVNKQSFFNHYTLPMALVVVAVVLVIETPRRAAAVDTPQSSRSRPQELAA